MSNAKQIIEELEKELAEFIKESENMDMSKVQHPAKWFARIAFYQAQAFTKVFKRLDEIEQKLEGRNL